MRLEEPPALGSFAPSASVLRAKNSHSGCGRSAPRGALGTRQLRTKRLYTEREKHLLSGLDLFEEQLESGGHINEDKRSAPYVAPAWHSLRVPGLVHRGVPPEGHLRNPRRASSSASPTGHTSTSAVGSEWAGTSTTQIQNVLVKLQAKPMGRRHYTPCPLLPPL